jgi:hypothetical protein
MGVLKSVFGGGTKTQASTSGVNLKDPSQLENLAMGVQGDQFAQLQDLLKQGPGAGDYSAGIQSQRDLAAMLGEYSKTGGLPNQQDIDSANQISGNLFAQRQTELNQSFTDQNTEVERLAARLGRPVNDPILQSKLRTGFIRQQDLLNAEKMGASQSQAGLLEALGQRAVDNRNFLLGLGSNLATSERNWRLQTGEQWGKQSQSGSGILPGLIGTAGAAMGAYGSFQSGNASVGLMNAQAGAYNRMGTPPVAPMQLQMPQAGGFNLGNFGSQFNANPFTPRTQFGLGGN